MQSLDLALIQSQLHWHQIDANLAMFEEKIWKIGKPVDLIVLPEMFNTGFTMDVKPLAEVLNSKTTRWMSQMAKQTKAVVTGSFIVNQEGRFYNRLLWMKPDGNYQIYDKRHLFRMANEHHYFADGEKLLITELKGWKICPLICYDLRFPAWSRNINNESTNFSYDVLLYVANWPAPRVTAWDILLKARAVENLCYSIGLNRVGEDGNGISYVGHSVVVDPKGEVIKDLGDVEGIHTITLDPEPLKKYREKFPAHLDADKFKLL
ncbi:MAG: amidohydrolase [Bacteroidetes bacterium]|nr:amidohydrolase [Bacteroidota bacterium]